MQKQVEINPETLDLFKAKMVEAKKFFKQLDQLTRQNYGSTATYESISILSKAKVRNDYIEFGGSLN